MVKEPTKIYTHGLTSDEWKLFNDLLLKANSGQILAMASHIQSELHKREQGWARVSNET